jgi:hypothetical protein
MPAPQPKHCLVCDLIRPEQAGKLSLLGFSGVCPDVELKIRDFEKLIEISFLVVCITAGAGTFSARFEIKDPAGKGLLPMPFTRTAEVLQTAARLNLGLSVQQLKLTGQGDYTLEVAFDNLAPARFIFKTSQGTSADFATNI